MNQILPCPKVVHSKLECSRLGATQLEGLSAFIRAFPHAQGKRNPSKTIGVARGHQRADTLKPYSQKTSQSNYTDHSLV